MYPNDPYYSGPPVVSAPPQPPAQHANTFATLSLVFAFVFAPAGAVLGHLGLAQIRRTGQRGHDRALIGTVLSYVFIVVAVVATVVWAVVREPGPSATPVVAQDSTTASASASASSTTTTAATTTTTTTAPPAPVVTAAQLPGLLLTLDEVRAQVKPFSSDYTATDLTRFNAKPGDSTVPAGCLPALYTGDSATYSGSGSLETLVRAFATLQVRTLMETGGMDERVTRYPDAAAATAQAAAIEKIWAGCVGTLTHSVNSGATEVRYQIDQVSHDPANPAVVVLTGTVLDGPELLRNRRMSHVLAAKNNIVVEVGLFGADPGDAAVLTTAAILTRIPG